MKTILLIEDDYLDVTNVQRALRKINAEHVLHIAHNGSDALAMLMGTSEAEKIQPDVILLDLNMPKMNGLEFLEIIKNYYSLKDILVFVMTTSNEEYDRHAAEKYGVNGYILKPLDFSGNSSTESGKATALLKSYLV